MNWFYRTSCCASYLALCQTTPNSYNNNLEKLLNDRHKTQTVLQMVQDDPSYLEIKAIVECES